MILKTIYRFRVLIEDNERPFDFYLHIFVRHSEPPRYQDLVERINHHSKNCIDLTDYIMTIQKDYCSYEFTNDHDFQEVLKYFTDQTVLEVKLFRKTQRNKNNNSIPVIKPIFSRPRIETNFRKDSGIFLPDSPSDLDKHKLTNSSNDPLKLPALSPLLFNDRSVSTKTKHDTSTKDLSPYPLTPLSPINPAISPSIFNYNFIKLPALSSVVPPSPSRPQVVPPIHPVIRSYFEKSSKSPTSSLVDSTPSTPLPSPLTPFTTSQNKGSKRARGSNSQPQFICEYVVDPSTEKICCQTFQRSYDLSRHQNIHLKNRPFCVCHQCGKKFTRLDALRRHERIQGHSNNKHSKQKLYQSQPV